MKQNYFMGLIACAALTMTGCSNDEINAPQQSQGNNAIEFSTYLGRNAQGSRGTETNTDSIKANGFGVLAYYTDTANFSADTNKPNFMWNQKVTHNGANWEYTPIKYWPTKVGDKVSFFAYAPYIENGNNNVIELSGKSATGTPTATITLPDDLSQTIDFVAAVQMNKTHDNAENANNNVSFTLKHEMTRVKVQAKLNKSVYNTDASNTQNKTFVVIKDVKFNNNLNFYKSGIYTFSTDDSKRGIWAPVTNDSKTTSLDLNKAMATETIKAKDAKSGDYMTGVNGVKLVDTTAKDLFKNKEYLYLIPVPVDGGNGSTATIKYDIVTEDSNLVKGYSCTSATKTVSLPAGAFQQGKSYNYTFIINLDEIVLDATVEKWDEPASDSNIDVPYTPDDATVKTNPGE
mgnify:CR=1 FL=1